METSSQYQVNEEAFLRDKEMLLTEHYGEFVIYDSGQLIGSCRNTDELDKLLENIGRERGTLTDIYIGGVNEVNFESLQNPPLPGELESIWN